MSAMKKENLNRLLNIMRSLHEEIPTNNVGRGKIAGTGDDPPVSVKNQRKTNRRVRKQFAYGGRGSRKWWLQNLKNNG